MHMKVNFTINTLIPRKEFQTAKDEELYLYSIKKELEKWFEGKPLCQKVEVWYKFSMISESTGV